MQPTIPASEQGTSKNNKMELFKLCKSGDEKTLKLLLKNEGVDLEMRDERGRTLLLAVASSVNIEDKIALSIIELLINKGADLFAFDNGGDNALHLAAANRNTRKDSIEYLINLGINVDRENLQGKAPLLFAIYRNNSESVKALLDRNANPLFLIEIKKPIFTI